jgi:integrase
MEARLWKDGKTVSYRFKPVTGPYINLGINKDHAILKVAQMNDGASMPGTVKDLWMMYQLSSAWKELSERTQNDYTVYSGPLLKVFSNAHVAAIRPAHVARYLRDERASAPVRANREKALLSNLMNLAIERGLIDVNLCKQVKRNKETPRDVSPEPELLQRFINWLSGQTPQRRIIAMAAEYASLAGNRKIEFLDLVWPQIDEAKGVIRVRRAKQRHGKVVMEKIIITPKMADLIRRLKEVKKDCLFVFPNSKNNRYTASGFSTMWQKCIVAAIDAGIICAEDQFTFHDLRAYYTTQYKEATNILPSLHKNPATTANIYERSKKSKRSAL